MTPPELEGPSGLLLVDKPEGPTSHDVVDQVRRLLGLRRVGHGGTLDPLATGLLPILIGSATRLVRFLPSDPKLYRVRARLGAETPSGDRATAPLQPERPVELGEEQIAAALQRLTGAQDQLPPMHSARKVGGRRLHRAARRGEVVARPTTRIVVHRISRLGPELPELHLEVVCSPGTYIRSLVLDLGRLLGTGAHVTRLRRLGSGTLSVADAVSLEGTDRARVLGALLPIDRIPLALPELRVSREALTSFRQGRPFAGPGLPPGDPLVALRSEEGLLCGVAESRPSSTSELFWPVVVLPAAGRKAHFTG